jgi:hypothetical protein
MSETPQQNQIEFASDAEIIKTMTANIGYSEESRCYYGNYDLPELEEIVSQTTTARRNNALAGILGEVGDLMSRVAFAAEQVIKNNYYDHGLNTKQIKARAILERNWAHFLGGVGNLHLGSLWRDMRELYVGELPVDQRAEAAALKNLIMKRGGKDEPISKGLGREPALAALEAFRKMTAAVAEPKAGAPERI